MVKKFRRVYKKRSTKVSPRVKRFVRKAIRRTAEIKRVSLSPTTTFSSIGASWVETDLTDITQGVLVSNRIGNEVTLTGLHLNATLVGGQVNSVTDDSRNIIRMVIALWEGNAGQTPLATAGATINSDIRADATTGNGLIRKYVDKVIELKSPGVDSSGYMPAVFHVKKFLRLRSKIKYMSATSSTAQRRLVVSCGDTPRPPFSTFAVRFSYSFFVF